MRQGLSIRERLELSSIPVPESGCWIWLKYCMANNGYGIMRIAHKSVLAHRASWIAHFGEIPDGKMVLHRCDIRPCVNPDHLFLGNHKINYDDMVAKGRRNRRDGVYNGRAKLTLDDVEFIRKSQIGQRGIVGKFGISRSAIKKIRDGDSWKIK